MWKILAISITILSLFSCSLPHGASEEFFVSTDFAQGKKLFLNAEYEKAEPYLIKTVEQEDQNYSQAVFFLGKIYDHTAQPEKAILNLRDFLKRGSGTQLDVLQAKALLLKNLAKVNSSIDNADEKKYISRVITSKNLDTSKALESLLETFNFNCGVYCVEEVNYLREIQVQLLYAIETDPELSKKASESLISSYNYFETFLKEPKMDLEYRKKIGLALYEALQKLKSSHLETSTLGSVKTAELISYLEASQKKIERWLYE
jgi:tetratricopeptide (TPR) repeat protein